MRYRALLEAAPDAVVVVNQSGAIVLVNAQAEKLFGYRRSELIGRPAEVLVSEHSRRQHNDQYSRLLTSQSVRPAVAGLELFGLRKDGSEFLAEIRLSPLDTNRGIHEIESPGDNFEKIDNASETILIVEDDAALLEVTHRSLEVVGYAILSARNPEEAIRIAESHPGPIHLMVTDVILPGINGAQLASQLSRLRPEMKVLFVSGYTDESIVRHGVLEPGLAFLQKHFSPKALNRKVGEMLAPPRLSQRPRPGKYSSQNFYSAGFQPAIFLDLKTAAETAALRKASYSHSACGVHHAMSERNY
jgi:PAS domain S-box-containing protein